MLRAWELRQLVEVWGRRDLGSAPRQPLRLTAPEAKAVVARKQFTAKFCLVTGRHFSLIKTKLPRSRGALRFTLRMASKLCCRGGLVVASALLSCPRFTRMLHTLCLRSESDPRVVFSDGGGGRTKRNVYFVEKYKFTETFWILLAFLQSCEGVR